MNHFIIQLHEHMHLNSNIFLNTHQDDLEIFFFPLRYPLFCSFRPAALLAVVRRNAWFSDKVILFIESP